MAVVKHKEQRVAVLVDVQNMYHSAKHLFGGRVNYSALLKAGVEGRRLIRSIAYVVRAELEEEKGFFDALAKAGFEVKIKELQVFPGGAKKADWDVGICMDAIRLANLIDALVLVTGDGDFVPLVEFLKFTKGIQVEVMAFGRSASARLKEATDDFIDLGQAPDKFIFRKIQSSPPRRR